jgi:2-hydroxy-3-keto-5-methylthiopentenyl-1-phosphate phosphatase
MCKCNIVNKYKKPQGTVLYIGDGGSDFCVSKKMETIFAKGKLLEYCKNNNIALNGLISFSSFKEILNFLSDRASVAEGNA